MNSKSNKSWSVLNTILFFKTVEQIVPAVESETWKKVKDIVDSYLTMLLLDSAICGDNRIHFIRCTAYACYVVRGTCINTVRTLYILQTS